MNYLMHLHLSGDDPDSLVGNMMGDFVKGRLDDRYPAGIRRGLELHRRIDSFAAGNPCFIRSKRRIDPSFGHFRGVLVDIFYDHFLARFWNEYRDTPYRDYLAGCRATLETYAEVLPERLRMLIPRIFAPDWLLSYGRMDGIGEVLRRMSRRINRPNPLSRGIGELALHYDELREDFTLFLPVIEGYVNTLPGCEPASSASGESPR